MAVDTYRVGAGDLPRDIPEPVRIPIDLAGQAAGGLAAGAGKLLDAGLTLWQKLREGEDEKQVLDALSRADDRMAAYRQELDKDEDYSGREQKFRSHVDKVYGEELGTIQMGAAQKEFQRRFRTLGRSQIVGVRHDAQQAGIQLQRQALQDATEGLMNKAVFARSDVERAVYLKQIDEAFRASVKNQTLSAIQAHAARRQTLGRFQYALADGLVQQSPGAAIAQLRDPKQFEYLSADQRMSLINRATQRGESLSAQARAEARATLQDYRQDRIDGRSHSEDEQKRIELTARRAGLGAQYDRIKTFHDQVDTHAGKPLPALRAAINDHEAKGTVDGNAVARALRTIEKKETSDAQRAFKVEWDRFEKTRQHGGAYEQEKLDRLVADADAAYGKEMADAVRQRDAFWSRMSEVAKEAPTATAARLQAFKEVPTLTLDQLDEQAAVQAAYNRKIKEFDTDPARAARTYYPTIGEAYDTAAKAKDPDAYRRANEALIDAQKREGVPEHRITLLTKDQAERIEAQLQADNGAGVVQTIDGLTAHFGPRGWPIVKRQLDAGRKLPPMIDVLASIPPGAVMERTTLAAAMRLSDGEAQKVLGDRYKKVGDEVRTRSTDAAISMVRAAGGAEKAALFQNAAEKLARHYVITQGLDESNAAKRAWDDVFYKHWDVSIEGLRIPKVNGQPVNDPADVRRAQSDAVKRLPTLDLMLPDGPDFGGQSAAQRKRALIEAVGRRGSWVTSADEKGMFLFVGPGIPVMTADGKPVFVPYPPRARPSDAGAFIGGVRR